VTQEDLHDACHNCGYFPTMLNDWTEIRWGRLAIISLAALAVYLLGQYVADMVMQRFDLVMHVRSEPTFHRLIMTASGIYMALMAIPFMPAVEVGLSMIAFFGAKICFLIYVCTVLALIPPYIVGRLIPAKYCAKAFGFLGLTKAQRLMEKIAPLSTDRRLSYLLDNVPPRIGPFLLRHRFLALAIVLNIPGNMVIGGGGGIALLAGMTGIYPLSAYLLTVALAVAPLPLFVTLVS
jgi:hypothetical protein